MLKGLDGVGVPAGFLGVVPLVYDPWVETNLLTVFIFGATFVVSGFSVVRVCSPGSVLSCTKPVALIRKTTFCVFQPI